MGKEDLEHIKNGILLSHKKEKIVPFAETLIDLEIVIQNEIRGKKHNITYMWNLEKRHR